MKNKKVIVSLIAGAVLAAGVGVWAVGSGSITIDKVENFNVTLSEAVGDGLGSLFGGVTNFNQVDVEWINTGDVASTTDGIWKADIRLRTTSGDSDDFWRNDTKGNVWVNVEFVNFFGNASSGMAYYIATSTENTFTNFTFTPTAPSTVTRQTDTLLHLKFATSTKDHVLTATSSLAVLLRPDENIVLEIINSDSSCSSTTDVTHGECEFATSTNRGFDLEAVFDVFATSTPLERLLTE